MAKNSRFLKVHMLWIILTSYKENCSLIEHVLVMDDNIEWQLNEDLKHIVSFTVTP